MPPVAILFAFLAAGFVGLAYGAASADAPWWRFMIAAVACIIAVWFLQTAYRMTRRR